MISSANSGSSSQQSIESVLTVVEAAKFLRVSESIVRRLIKERRIPYFQIEGRYLFYKLKLEDWINILTINPSGPDQNSQSRELADAIWDRKEGKT